MSSFMRKAGVIVMIAVGIAATAAAQTTQNPESGAVAQGRALLSQGDLPGASALAARLLTQYPKSAEVAGFLVEVTVVRQGATAGLNTYERWQGPDPREQRDILRYLARAFLLENARNPSLGPPRIEALEALVDDGDPNAVLLLNASENSTVTLPETTLRASRGDERAIRRLIDALKDPPPVKRSAIIALGRTHSQLAVAPLVEAFTDDNPLIRAAAAEALGKLGFPEALAPLKSLLNDQVFNVRYVAATALLELKDVSGLPLLRKMETDEHPGVRLAAATAMKTIADGQWMSLVRQLTADPDPSIRREAAVLLAPHDPDAARITLQELLTNDNPAEREAASDAVVRVLDNLTALRMYLHSTDALTRGRAAARILKLS